MATETNETSSQDEQDGKDVEGQTDEQGAKGQSETKDQGEGSKSSGTSNDGSPDERAEDDKPFDDADEKSQADLAEEAAEAKRKQEAESKKKAGSIILIASVILGAIGLLVLLASTSVNTAAKLPGGPEVQHPLVEQMLAVLGIVNLGLAAAVFIRKNWPRALILVVMPITIVLLLLNLSLVGPVKYAIIVLCIVEIYVMFRRPILDEFDAPQE